MTIEVKHAGAWRNITSVEVKHAGAWRNCQTVEVKHGGVWRTVFSSAPTVTLVDSGVSWSYDFTTYAMVRYGADGNEYKNATASTSTTTGARGTPGTNWLTSGSASGAWVYRSISSGSLWTDGITASGAQMTSDRTIGVRDTNSAAGGVSCTLTVTMRDASGGGGNLLDTGGPFTLTATYYNACPLCCFTPDTLITMSDGKQIPIGMIREGDEIVVYNPNGGTFDVETVEEILVRVARKMYKITFEDGTVIHASDDHPFHVDGVGPASIVPQPAYKHEYETTELKVGDFVTCIKASWWEGHDVEKITKIEYAEYLEEVYTLGNSYFFANNKLVY